MPPPEHIVIETSGLALPKPLIKAFNWPEIRTRVTVDGVVAVVDAAAVRDGLFASRPGRARGAARRPIPRSITTARSRSCSRSSSPPPIWWWSTRRTCWRTGDWPAVERAGARRAAPGRAAGPRPPCRRADRRCCSGSARRPRAISMPAPRITTTAATTSTTTSRASTSTLPALDDLDAFVARLEAMIARHPILRVKGFARGRRQADAPGPAGRRRSHPALLRSRLATGRGARGPARGDRRARPRPGGGRGGPAPAEPELAMHLLNARRRRRRRTPARRSTSARRRATSCSCRPPTPSSPASPRPRRAGPTDAPSLRLANLLQLGHPLSVDLYVEQVVAQRAPRGRRACSAAAATGPTAWSRSRRLPRAAASRSPCCPATISPTRSSPAGRRLPAEACHRLWQYCVQGGLDNAAAAAAPTPPACSAATSPGASRRPCCAPGSTGRAWRARPRRPARAGSRTGRSRRWCSIARWSRRRPRARSTR